MNAPSPGRRRSTRLGLGYDLQWLSDSEPAGSGPAGLGDGAGMGRAGITRTMLLNDHSLEYFNTKRVYIHTCDVYVVCEPCH